MQENAKAPLSQVAAENSQALQWLEFTCRKFLCLDGLHRSLGLAPGIGEQATIDMHARRVACEFRAMCLQDDSMRRRVLNGEFHLLASVCRAYVKRIDSSALKVSRNLNDLTPLSKTAVNLRRSL